MHPADRAVLHTLEERVKELTALHQTARLMQDDQSPMHAVVQQVVQLLPPAWQYPSLASARISFDGLAWTSTSFAESPWTQAACFRTQSGHTGHVEVFYRERICPDNDNPFLPEERALIESLAEMLRLYCERKLLQEDREKQSEELERNVRERTEQLEQTNRVLEAEIVERRQRDQEIADYQARLRRLAVEATRAEQRERREIAQHLHDHVGQALSLLKIKVATLQGNAVFCGFDRDLAEMRRLLDQVISFTRSLTVQLSPPVLYDLGLGPALEWLAEEFSQKTPLRVSAQIQSPIQEMSLDTAQFLFTSVRELVHNASKHAQASHVIIHAHSKDGCMVVSVQDDGVGFSHNGNTSPPFEGFGLFSIRERARDLNGRVRFESTAPRGAHVFLEVPIGGRDDDPCRADR